MNKCLNYQVCHNFAKRGHDLCQQCIDAACTLDEEPIYLPELPKDDEAAERKLAEAVAR